jgi:hypothetical protein
MRVVDGPPTHSRGIHGAPRRTATSRVARTAAPAPGPRPRFRWGDAAPEHDPLAVLMVLFAVVLTFLQ